MSNRNLVICDREEGYAEALAVFLMRRKELAFQVQVCGDITQAQTVLQERPIDILLIGGAFPAAERRRLKAGKVFLLTGSGKTEADDGETVVYKYQSGEAILAEVIRKCSEEEDGDSLFIRTVKAGKIRIIGIFSPVHRSGKTGYGLKLGRELAVSENVLYLNMELYGGIGGYFPKEGHTLADVLYYARQESRNFGLVLTTLVERMDGLDCLLPARVSEDVRSVTAEEWVGLIRQIGEQSIYDVMILDIDEGLKGVYDLLRVCTEIHVPAARDMIAAAKLLQMDEELRLLGYDDVKKKMVKRESVT
ncbi:MAG: hypothetical protein HFG89_08895 [Dorea sp.]|nr:hypothetical protein [Dorea sp.]